MVEEMSLFHISYDSGIVSVGRMYPAGIALKYMSLFILTKNRTIQFIPIGPSIMILQALKLFIQFIDRPPNRRHIVLVHMTNNEMAVTGQQPIHECDQGHRTLTQYAWGHLLHFNSTVHLFRCSRSGHNEALKLRPPLTRVENSAKQRYSQ